MDHAIYVGAGGQPESTATLACALVELLKVGAAARTPEGVMLRALDVLQKGTAAAGTLNLTLSGAVGDRSIQGVTLDASDGPRTK